MSKREDKVFFRFLSFAPKRKEVYFFGSFFLQGKKEQGCYRKESKPQDKKRYISLTLQREKSREERTRVTPERRNSFPPKGVTSRRKA
ncbi:hypothetical protein FACS189499_07300 [Clostridia bacterium]|nr:hypothetical protein FACS189499_07300 [Clostridia bacterium]